MTNAVQRGKPDAGNPHVRFDEGEVASAKPRRRSLLYKFNLSGLLSILLLACGSAFATQTPIPYIDESGREKLCTEYTVLTSGTPGVRRWFYDDDLWLVVPSGESVSSGPLSFAGQSTHLILCDGAKLEINPGGATSLYGINFTGDLAIYGQQCKSGILEVHQLTSSQAGIGGYSGNSFGTLTLANVIVIARGGTDGGAGIGGSSYGRMREFDEDDYWGGKIRIFHSTVVAFGGSGAAGIGSGRCGCRVKVSVRDSSITAFGGSNGAGIGTGEGTYAAPESYWEYDTTFIRIDSSTVKATGGYQGPGIGVGSGFDRCGSDWLRDSDWQISIAGDSVTAVGGTYGAGIGSGANALYTPTVYIDGDKGYEVKTTVVTATGGLQAAGIGGGTGTDSPREVFLRNCTVTATGGSGGAGIGGGWGGNSGLLRINDIRSFNYSFFRTKLVASGGTGAAGVGAGAGGTSRGRIEFSPGPDSHFVVLAGADESPSEPKYPGWILPLDPSNPLSDTEFVPLDTCIINTNAVYHIDQLDYQWPTVFLDGERYCVVDPAPPPPIAYIGADGTAKECVNYTIMKDTTAELGNGKWYVVPAGANLSRGTITVNGSSNLILCDGGTLSARGLAEDEEAGIRVAAGNSLTVYGQSAGTGTLNADSVYKGAGIGGASGESCGTITINGGTVNANGNLQGGAGIGGGWDGDGGTITINGGTVNATGGNTSAGIGGGNNGDGGSVTINGGTVNATGAISGAGIGGGESGNGGTVSITGGSVTAKGGYAATGIGSGVNGFGGAVSITGGSVSAIGGGGGGAGIGGDIGPGTLTVSNGVVVKAGSAKDPTAVKEHGEGGAIALAGERFYTTTAVATAGLHISAFSLNLAQNTANITMDLEGTGVQPSSVAVESKTDLLDAEWQTVVPLNSSSGSGTVTVQVPLTDSTRGYFRAVPK